MKLLKIDENQLKSLLEPEEDFNSQKRQKLDELNNFQKKDKIKEEYESEDEDEGRKKVRKMLGYFLY